MKIVKIADKGKAELVDVPDPKAKDEFVVVKIHVTPMCTEYKMFKAGGVHQSIGHEAAGEVVEVAGEARHSERSEESRSANADPSLRSGRRVKVGDRVVVMPQTPCGRCALCLAGEYIHCQHTLNLAQATGYKHGGGTYAQYILKQDWLLVPIPDSVSYEHAGMACCGLGPTFAAMRAMDVSSFDTVLITGMGPVGLGGVINGVFRGARVIAVEGHPYRARLAKQLEAETVIDPNSENPLKQVLDLTGGVGVDKAVDCSGAAPAQRLMIDAARRKGQVSFVGEAGDLTIKVSGDLIRKGLILRGIWHYNLADTPRIMEVIRKSGRLLDKQITHTFPMSQVQKAFELQVTGECGKVLLYPWQ